MEVFLLHLPGQEEGERPGDLGAMGYVCIHLRGQRAAEYMPCQLSRSKKGWHWHWFYLKSDPAAPLPVFSRRLIEEVPPSWPWGPPIKEKKRMHDLLKAIAFLKTHDLRGASVIREYHTRRMAPLMARVLPLYGMTLGMQLVGTTLT